MTKAKPAKRSPAKGDGNKTIKVEFVEGHGSDDEIRRRCKALKDGDSFSPETQNEVVRLLRLFQESDRSPRYQVDRDENGNPDVRPPDDVAALLTQLRLVETFASRSNELVTQRIGELATYHNRAVGSLSTRSLSADLAFVRSGHAEDAVQSTLLTQMAATHDAAMQALGRLNGAEYAETAQLWGNLSSKLLARFTAQAETLAKLQRGGEQVIKHVHIDNRGGQAVVAEQFIKGGSGEEQRDQSHALGPAMLGQNAPGHTLPVPGDQGAEAVPDAQWTGKGRSEGE